ncbi:hypothetical protein [Blautia massiliensis (ex Durand et al. 2017)]|uniref:hypothetical protein n=1 Tax=Blautia massiliensis (ex Durand et al. 2017) TaxID=1737424 RepID=UPI0039A02A68
MAELQVNRQYKDRVFRMIFNSREKLLELYNAMNGTDYEDAEELEIVTLENAVYLAMRNDMAYVFHDELFLYEQQSSKNGNMPLRCLFYVSDSYSRMVRGQNLYGSRQIKIPAPTFVVFYNGKDKIEEGEVLLSDAYSKKMEVPNLELRVKVWNINLGNSEEIYKKSRTMHDYMIFVDKTRRYSEQYPLEDAIEQTVEECIREGVLRDFLQANRAEVKKMCLYEYDEEQQRKWDREEGREEGREEEKRIMAERLLEQKLLPEEKIMEVVGFTVEEWNEVKEELEKKKNNVE